MEHTEQDRLWIWLGSVEGIGAQSFYTLIAAFGDAGEVYRAKEDDPRLSKLSAAVRARLKKAQTGAYMEALFGRLEKKGIKAVSRLHPDYPPPLQDIFLPPPALYVRGRLPVPLERAVAVVGSRRATRYGLEAAFTIGRDLALMGITVVSGLARGIDARAHEGALEVGGPVAGVLGCGVDVAYPKENARLCDRVAECGSLLSEYALGTRPLPGNFPMRNRIMSGLCRAAVVVEAGAKSGALITADHALAQGRDVYAVPGSIFSPACEGSNRLLSDGAAPLLKAEDIALAYGWGRQGKKAPQKAVSVPDDPLQQRIAARLSSGPASFDELADALGMEAGKLNSVLTIMELSGIIIQLSGRMFSLPEA